MYINLLHKHTLINSQWQSISKMLKKRKSVWLRCGGC